MTLDAESLQPLADEPAAAALEPPATNGLATITASPELLARIDAAVALDDPGRRGWCLADAARPDLCLARVDVRDWLLEPGGVPGLRAAREAGPLVVDGLPAGYGVVLLAREPAVLEEPALQTMRAAIAAGRPCLCLFGAAPAELRWARGGRLGPLPPATVLSSPARLRIQLRAHGELKADATLPASFEIESAAPHDVLFVRGALPGGSGDFEELEVRSRDGAPLGRVSLRLDFRPETGGDRLVVAPDSTRVEVRALGRRRKLPPLPARTLCLHLAFDRTTLDADNWPRALEAIWKPAEHEEQRGFQENQRPKRHWNLDLRRQLAAALDQQLARLDRKVALDLWWFADEARPGIAAPDGLPTATEACGHTGSTQLAKLGDSLLGSEFDYSCGMDLFDAADEVLEAIADHLAERSRERHAVLIVGDSPPPPADPADPLWRRIVEGDPRTNARCSPHFRQALAKLAHAGAVVGWLFVRHPRGPESKSPGLDDYARFQTLREKVLAALEQHQPALLVEGCDGIEDLPRSLANLLARMRKEHDQRVVLPLQGSGQ